MHARDSFARVSPVYMCLQHWSVSKYNIFQRFFVNNSSLLWCVSEVDTLSCKQSKSFTHVLVLTHLHAYVPLMHAYTHIYHTFHTHTLDPESVLLHTKNFCFPFTVCVSSYKRPVCLEQPRKVKV